jgi:hypothetical protein
MTHAVKIAVLVLCGAFLCLIASIQIEQHVLRRRAERLLSDIRSLEIHRSSLSDVQRLSGKWGRLAHYQGNCADGSCSLEILWKDFSLRHIEFLSRLDTLHFFILAGGRPEQVSARVTVEKDAVVGKAFHVLVGVAGDRAQGRWWDYPLMGDAYSLASFDQTYGPGAKHPDYIVGRPGGCDGPCLEVHFIFDPSLDRATIDRLMQFDLSCLTRWVRPCRTEGDLMPNAWAQYKKDYSQTTD